MKRLVALFVLAVGLAGCGGASWVGSPGPTPPLFAGDERTSPLPTGVDAKTELQKRQVRPPALALFGGCPVSGPADLATVAPNYGLGVGPVYMSGQDSWYAGGQVVVLTVDSRYSGPLLVRGFQLGSDGKSRVTLAELPPPANAPVDKERQHGVAVVPGLHTPGGELYLEAADPSSFWRGWFGWLTTNSPGCFGLQMDGDVFTEFIVFSVKAGTPPPG